MPKLKYSHLHYSGYAKEKNSPHSALAKALTEPTLHLLAILPTPKLLKEFQTHTRDKIWHHQ